MTKQLEKWEELYKTARQIREYEPWDDLIPNVPLMYHREDGLKIYYMLYINMNNNYAISFYTSPADYFCARDRMGLAMLRGEPADALQTGFGCAWEDRDDMSKDELKVIKGSGAAVQGKRKLAAFQIVP